MYAEEDGVANGLVKLSGMAWQHIHPLKDKSPRYISNFTDDFGIHEVPEADGAGTDRSDDGHIVEYMNKAQFHMSGIEPKGNHQAKRAAVTGKTFVAGELPTLTRNIAHR